MPDKTNQTFTERIKGGFKRRFVREQVYDFALHTREIAGPLQFTSCGLFMWVVLGPQQWDFLPKGRRLQRSTVAARGQRARASFGSDSAIRATSSFMLERAQAMWRWPLAPQGPPTGRSATR